MKNHVKKAYIVRDNSFDMTNRSAIPLKIIDNTIIPEKNIEMKNLLADKRLDEKVVELEINRKTDRHFLFASIKCAIPKNEKLNCKFIKF